MKANEAPEKVYVHKSQYWGLMANEYNITKNGIEYTRTDAFIEKACEWLQENKDKYLYNTGKWDEYIPTCSGKMIEDFRKYMEGE